MLFRLVKSSYSLAVFLCFFSSLLSSVGSMELISTRLSAAFVSNTPAGEREKEREMEGPIFPSRRVSHSSLEGGFSCSPLSFFGQEQREYVGTMHQVRSGWFGWKMLRRRVAFNPQNQFASRKLHRTKLKHTLRALALDTREK